MTILVVGRVAQVVQVSPVEEIVLGWPGGGEVGRMMRRRKMGTTVNGGETEQVQRERLTAGSMLLHSFIIYSFNEFYPFVSKLLRCSLALRAARLFVSHHPYFSRLRVSAATKHHSTR